MTSRELPELRLELLDEIHALSQTPMGDAEGARERVIALFDALEEEFGEEEV
jgi:hypothetical protein